MLLSGNSALLVTLQLGGRFSPVADCLSRWLLTDMVVSALNLMTTVVNFPLPVQRPRTKIGTAQIDFAVLNPVLPKVDNFTTKSTL